MKKSFKLLLTAVFLFHPSLSHGLANPFGVSEELDKSIKDGLHALYAMDFDQAENIFNAIDLRMEKEHPMVAFGKASVHWWRLSVFVLESDQEESRPFLEAVNKCIELSKNKLKEGDKTGEGHLTLGGAYGLLGRWQATNQRWLSGYFTGLKAIKYLRKSLKINPQMFDAYMGLGIFDYYVATLPAVIRVLAFLGSNNDPKVGLNELETAAHQGTYSQTPSQLFLTDLYANQENNPEKAFELLVSLRKDYPTSSFIHMLEIITLYNHNQLDKLRAEVHNFLERIEHGIYKREFYPNGYFAAGMIPFKSREWENAVEKFNLAIQYGTVKNPFFTWSYLYKGYALDMLGERNEAKAQYREVLNQIRRWGSHDAAKKGLSKPFEGEDFQLEKIRL